MIPELVRRSIAPSPGTCILDVGAGHGENARALAEAGFTVCAVEIQRYLVDELRTAVRGYRIRVCRADATRLPLRSESLDGAILIEVMEHLDEPEEVLREVHRVLRPGAHLWIALPTGYTEAVYWRLHPRYAQNAGHVRYYGRRSAEATMLAAGFKVCAVETRNLAPALSWFVHALVRSRSDDTGRIHNHRWIDWVVLGMLAPWRFLPGLRATYRWVAARFGKSWYFDCVRV